MSVRIYGAGMAGLLASTMLRRFRPMVFEAQPSLPDNHGALLRFRSDAVAHQTGQDFRRVRVTKAVKIYGSLCDFATIREANQYSLKVTGEVRARSVMDLAVADRYIAPDDFISTMARDAILQMSHPLTKERLEEIRTSGDDHIVSTIPMPVLMSLVNWPTLPQFRYRAIWSVTAELPRIVDVYQTIYYPGPQPYYRASITGSRLILEYAEETGTPDKDHAREVLEDFGLSGIRYDLHDAKRQEYGKLLPISEAQRQEFILAMTDQYNIYSVGRFATWRQILLDDVVKDLHHVERWITQRNSYHRRLEAVKAV